MAGKGGKGLVAAKTTASNKDKDKRKPMSRSARAGIQDSIKDQLASIKVEVNSLKVDVSSLKSTLDLLPTKADLHAILTLLKESDEDKKPAQKKAKKESSSNVSREELYEEEEKETPKLPQDRHDYGGTITIFVKGYDYSLPEDDIKRALTEHFSSCGRVIRVYFHRDQTVAPVRYGFIELVEGLENALKLNGSKMGGKWNLEVANAKLRDEYYVNTQGSGPYRRERQNAWGWDRRNYQKEKPPVAGSCSKINKHK